MRLRAGLLLVGLLGCGVAGLSQQAPVKKNCAVSAAEPTAAEQALLTDGARAEALYLAIPASSATTAGVVRAKLKQEQLDEALKLATQEEAAHPDDAVLLDVLGEVRYRRGEVVEAAALLPGL